MASLSDSQQAQTPLHIRPIPNGVIAEYTKKMPRNTFPWPTGTWLKLKPEFYVGHNVIEGAPVLVVGQSDALPLPVALVNVYFNSGDVGTISIAAGAVMGPWDGDPTAPAAA